MKIIEYNLEDLDGKQTGEYIFELRYSPEPMPKYAKMLGFTTEGFYFASDSGIDVIGPYPSIEDAIEKKDSFHSWFISKTI